MTSNKNVSVVSCGYAYEPTDSEELEDCENSGWEQDGDTFRCTRGTWDHEDTDRCRLHARVSGKTEDDLFPAAETSITTPGDTPTGRRRFWDAFFRDANFKHCDYFKGADMSGAHLEDATLIDTNLSKVRLNNASLINAKLQGARLQKASLCNADLTEANLQGANLSAAVLVDSTLDDVRFSNTTLNDETALSDSTLIGVEILNESVFNGAELQEVEIEAATICDSKFVGTDLRGATFGCDTAIEDTNMTDAEFAAAEFSEVCIVNSGFKDVDMTGESPETTTISEVSITNSQFDGADLSNARLENLRVSDNSLRGAKLPHTEIINAGLKNADLSGVCLKKARIERSDLRKAIFKGDDGTDRQPTNMEDVVFDEVDLRGTKFGGARIHQAVFTDIRINGETTFTHPTFYQKQANTAADHKSTAASLKKAAWVNRRIERLLDDNAMSERARKFHVEKQEADRSRQYHQAWRPDASLPECARSTGRRTVLSFMFWVTGYGESFKKLFGWSIIVILFCGLVYPINGLGSGSSGPVHSYSEGDLLAPFTYGLYFSLTTFSTIGFGELYPAWALDRVLVGVESLAGGVLIALFIFMLGRRIAR